MAESADAAPATPFSELYALKWLNQTLLDLDGQAKRVGESDAAYENRLTSRWLGRARLSLGAVVSPSAAAEFEFALVAVDYSGEQPKIYSDSPREVARF